MICDVCDVLELELLNGDEEFELDVDFEGEIISGNSNDEYQKGYDEGYTKGYADGESDGYDKGEADGYSNGYKDGQINGYSSGFNDGQSDGYTKGYDKGKTDGELVGYEQGKSDGYKDGYDKGYSVGYNAGFEKGKSEGGAFPAEFEWAKHTKVKPYFDDDSWATEETVIYIPNVSSIAEFLYNKKLTKIKTLTIKTDVPVTNANYFLRTQNDTTYAFLKRLILECDFSQCDKFNQFLQFQRKLVSIEGQPLNLSSATYFNLDYLVVLESFRVAEKSIEANFSVAQSPKLDADTIQSIIEGLAKWEGNPETETPPKLTLHSNVILKLTDEQYLMIDNKNWILA